MNSRRMENVMRPILALWLCLLFASPAIAQESPFSKCVKASLFFTEDPQFTRHYGYPHVILVWLRVQNITDSRVSWYADSERDLDAELLDSNGIPVPAAVSPGPKSIGRAWGNPSPFWLPHASRLDWLISHNAIAPRGDPKGKYALIVGHHGWLIPAESVESYSLRIRLRGFPSAINDKAFDHIRAGDSANLSTLFDLPPTKIKIAK